MFIKINQSKALLIWLSDMIMWVALTRDKIGRASLMKDAFCKKYFSKIMSYGLYWQRMTVYHFVCIFSLLILLCHTLIVVMCTTKRKLTKYFSTNLQYYIYLRTYPVKTTSELTPNNGINKNVPKYGHTVSPFCLHSIMY